MVALIPCNSSDSTKVYLPNLESATLHLPKTKGSERTEAHKFYEKIGYDKSKTQAKFQKIF